MTLGDVINAYRNEHRCSMDAFASASGLSKAYISMLEKNENPKTKQPITPSIVTFKCAAMAMGLSLDELLRMVDENQPVYLVAEPKGLTVSSRGKPFVSDYGVRVPSFKMDSSDYDFLVQFAEENQRTLEDEIGQRLHDSIEADLEHQEERKQP